VIQVLKAGIVSQSSTVEMSNARQAFSKHVPVATTVHTAIEKLLEALFSMQCILKLHRWDP
jgi:hypothetical protein